MAPPREDLNVTVGIGALTPRVTLQYGHTNARGSPGIPQVGADSF